MIDVKIEILLDATGGFGPWFTLDESELDGPDILAPDNIWVDITGPATSFSIRRGRESDQEAFTAGTASITFNNQDRSLDPSNLAGPYAGNLIPLRQMRISAVSDGVEFPLFRGFVQRWRPLWPEFGQDARVVVELSDALSVLANQGLEEIAPDFGDELSGARVTRVLNLPEVDFPVEDRLIDTGLTIFGPTTFGGTALAYLNRCALSESGSLFVDAAGRLRFVERGAGFADPGVVFGHPAGVGEIPFRSLEGDFGVGLLYNRIVASGVSGNEIIRSDVLSQAAYRVRTLDRRGLFVRDDSEVEDLADWLLARFSTPDLRFSSLGIRPDKFTDEAIRAQILGVELGDVLRVRTTPPGSGSPTTIEQVVIVDSLAWGWSAEGLIDCEIGMSGGSRVAPFILDSADFGVLDQNSLGY